MTPLDAVIALLLAWLVVQFIDMLWAPVTQRRPVVIALVLLLSFVWVYMTSGA